MRLRALAMLVGVGALAVILFGAVSATAGPPEGEDLDLASALPLTLDAAGLTEIPAIGGGSTGTGSPPRLGDNVFANAPQALAPAGLVGRSETTLTLQGQSVLAGWNDAQGFCGPPLGAVCTPPSPAGLSGYGYSTDGGQTWTDGGAPDPFGGVLSRGDPWMDNNGSGTFYFANLAIDQDDAESLGVGVWRGSFNGSTFAWNDVKTFDSPVNATTPGFDFYDKEAIVSGKNSQKNDAYVSLTNFQGFGPADGCPVLPENGFGQIEVWRTHDGGSTWHGPTIAGPEAADSAADCGNSGTLQQSSVPAIAPNGDLYVVWQYGPTFAPTGAFGATAAIKFAKSTNGGETFSTPTTVANINSMRANPPIGYNRARNNDHPRIDVATTGKYKGRIYVTYYSSATPVSSTAGPTNTQVLVNVQTFIKYSDDGGQTWSTPKEIGGALPSPLPTGVGAIKRWWPDVSISPGGEVHVVYMEERATQLTASPTDTECTRTTDAAAPRVGRYSSLVDTWWTYSNDGGASWSMPLKLSSGTSPWCTPNGNVGSNIRPNMGDYIDAQAGPGLKVYGLWADGRDLAPLGPNFVLVAGSMFGAGKS
jgi:BNR/Asp-box repeat